MYMFQLQYLQNHVNLILQLFLVFRGTLITYSSLIFLCETGSHVAHVGLKMVIYPKMTMNCCS